MVKLRKLIRLGAKVATTKNLYKLEPVIFTCLSGPLIHVQLAYTNV
jgi:hypothetical protein